MLYLAFRRATGLTPVRLGRRGQRRPGPALSQENTAPAPGLLVSAQGQRV